MRVIVNLAGCKDDQGCAVVYNDREILEAINGDESLVRVVFSVQESLLNNAFGKGEMPPKLQCN